MSFSHLLNSRVKVLRASVTKNDGLPEINRVPAPGLSFVPVRMDLNFIRIGKDTPPVVEAGVQPDRFGTLFTETAGLKAGDYVQAVPDEFGNLPITGTFEVKAVPDQAIAYSAAHHYEVSIVEVSQRHTANYPGET